MDALALTVRDLGREAYEPVWRRMQAFTDQRDASTGDELWLVEHPPVFTLGQAATRDHVLAPGDIPLLQVDRGGQVTYHGPGQAVLYPLWDLKRAKIGIRTLVAWLEQSVIDWLAEHHVTAERREKAPGVYVSGQKIASLGLRVRRGCSFHGMAVNVAMDLQPFSRINPCGFEGLEMTQSSALGISEDWRSAGMTLIQRLADLSGHIINTKEGACV
ncbi:MAG: lipoyl(octanoyl) transferase LipB [Pseudomonadota bacterium]